MEKRICSNCGIYYFLEDSTAINCSYFCSMICEDEDDISNKYEEGTGRCHICGRLLLDCICE